MVKNDAVHIQNFDPSLLSRLDFNNSVFSSKIWKKEFFGLSASKFFSKFFSITFYRKFRKKIYAFDDFVLCFLKQIFEVISNYQFLYFLQNQEESRNFRVFLIVLRRVIDESSIFNLTSYHCRNDIRFSKIFERLIFVDKEFFDFFVLKIRISEDFSHTPMKFCLESKFFSKKGFLPKIKSKLNYLERRLDQEKALYWSKNLNKKI